MAFPDLTPGLHSAVFSVFGEPVVVNGVTATGVFTAAHEAVDVSAGVPVSSTQPVLEMREQDMPEGIEEGDAVTVRGVSYVVADVRPDGYGVLKLLLHKASKHDG
jgi:hypothetical protein